MTQDELETAIKQRWEAGWLAIHGPGPAHVPFTYLNESFDAVDVYAHLAVEPSARTRTTQGRAFGRYSLRGIIRVRLFGTPDVGGTQLAKLSDEIIGVPNRIVGVLEEKRIGDLIYREGSQRPGPSNARWTMRVVTVPYELRV